jgi:hypothetical protein
MGNVSDKTLAELEEMERAATPRPWDDFEEIANTVGNWGAAAWVAPKKEDEALALAARNALPDLLAEVKHLRALHQGDYDRLATIAELAMRTDVDPSELLRRIYNIAVDVGEFTSTQRTVGPEEP